VTVAGTLGGSGFIAGPVTVLANGKLSPGNSPGKLSIAGDTTLNGGSNYVVEFNGATSPGTNFDQLAVGGAFNPSGSNLFVSSPANAPFAPTDVIPIVTYGTVTGTFSGLPDGAQVLFADTGSGPGGFYLATINYGSVTPLAVTLSNFQPVPEPTLVFGMCAAAAGTLGWVRRRRAT
jgi:hypothetical protein